MVLAQLCAGQFQRLIQLVQRLHGIIQPEQAAVPQTVVSLFLVEGLQQCLQLTDRELAGVHFQIQNAAVDRHPHRDPGRSRLQVPEGIGQVDLALCQQRRDALLQKAVDRLFLIGLVFRGHAAAHGVQPWFQIPAQQTPCPLFGAGVPQQTGGGRLAGAHPVLPVQEFCMGRHSPHLRGIQIKLHHRFQRDLIQQQPLRVLNGHPVPQLRQHIAAECGGVALW